MSEFASDHAEKAPQAFAPLTPPTQGCHVGLDPCLIDEHEPFRIQATLPCLPPQAPTSDIGAGLLKSKQCFF